MLELQNTLDDLTHRVDKVKEENLKLKSENSVLGQYIENLMQASLALVNYSSTNHSYVGQSRVPGRQPKVSQVLYSYPV